MVSARSTTFLLVFILLLLRFSTAHTQQHQGKKTMVVVKLETTTSPVRKMMSRGVLLKSNVVESENGINMTKGKRVLELKNKDSRRSNADSVPLNADYYVPRPHPPKNN